MNFRETSEGHVNLYLFRGGTVYEERAGLPHWKEWNNARYSLLPYAPTRDVVTVDVRKRLSFPSATFDVVYACHVVEHLDPDEADRFVAEIYRILRPGGLFRVSVPNLEISCMEYLERLEAALAEPSDVNLKKYRWAVLDLIDQNARDRPGGIMFECLQQGDFDPDYLKHRYGDVFSKYWSKFERSKQESVRVSQSKLDRMTHHLKRPRQTLYALLRKWFIFLKASDPRAIGETNGWMYDRLSIKRLMEGQNFVQVSKKAHDKSVIESWKRFRLDESDTGEFQKSLYVEGRKPV